MHNKIRVVQYGLGPIGLEAAKLVLAKEGLELVGGVDIDPAKAGVDLGIVLGLDETMNMTVSSDAEKLLATTKPDVVLHSTGSFLQTVEGQLNICIESNCSVVSSCEELFYPYRRDAEFAARLDGLAKKRDVTITATGVNPGFSLDVLVLTASSVCTEVQRVEAIRVNNASLRRLPLQRKVGAGLSPDDFRKRADEGKLGHIGLVESLAAVADRLGLELDEIQETIDPQIASKTEVTPYLQVRPGEAAGILHVARGLKGDREIIKLELRMYVGAEEEVDRVQIEGEPNLDLKVEGGIFGDRATIARMVNAIPIVHDARPGLVTAVDLGIPCCLK